MIYRTSSPPLASFHKNSIDAPVQSNRNGTHLRNWRIEYRDGLVRLSRSFTMPTAKALATFNCHLKEKWMDNINCNVQLKSSENGFKLNLLVIFTPDSSGIAAGAKATRICEDIFVDLDELISLKIAQ